MAAHDRADPDLLQPSAERAADRSGPALHAQLPRRDARPAIPVRLRPELHHLCVFRSRRRDAEAEGLRYARRASRDQEHRQARRQGGGAALYPRSGREPQPAGARAESVREGRAGAGRDAPRDFAGSRARARLPPRRRHLRGRARPLRGRRRRRLARAAERELRGHGRPAATAAREPSARQRQSAARARPPPEPQLSHAGRDATLGTSRGS